MNRKTFRKLVIENDYNWHKVADKVYKPKYEASAKTKQDSIDYVERLFALYEKLKRLYGYYGKGDHLAYKANLANTIKECTEDGKFASNWDRTDCDSFNVISSFTWDADTPLVKIVADIQDGYEQAEGRVSHYISKPSEMTEFKTRDLALEAFENGHPSTIIH
tara:strand:- start:21 stop:509 length:489 start_codon:yes stop_codon:yes gene_type:complete